MSKFNRMLKSLPSLYRPETNTMVGGLLKAWAISDDEIEIQVANTKDQLFQATAEGRYLDYLASNVGVAKDPNLGISDSDYQKLIPVLSFYPKQVRKTLIALLDVFWGESFTRPNLNSGNVETYNFGVATTITGTASFFPNSNELIGTGTLFTSELSPGDYIKAISASGIYYQKVSSIESDTKLIFSTPYMGSVAINSQINLGVVLELDYITDQKNVKTIRFKPYAFANLAAVTVAELVAFINADPEHNKFLTASVYADPLLGNKLNLRTNTAGLAGAIQITGGDANTGILNFTTDLKTEVRASVYELNPNEVVVRIPSSVPILRRTLKGAVHPQYLKSEILSNTDQFDFNSLGATSTLTLDIDGNPFTVTFTNSSDFEVPASAEANEVATAINAQLVGVEAYVNNKKVALRTSNGSSEFQITGGTANSILGFSTSLQTDSDLIVADRPSSYVFDPDNQTFTVTGTNTGLNQTISSGSLATSVQVDNSASFPNLPGSLIFDYGKSNQEGPISYNSRPNNSTLLIDASYVFQKEHTADSTVNLVQNSATLPRVTGVDYPVFVVGTESARAAAQNLIRQLLAAGVVIRFIIDTPTVLFECTCSGCGASDLVSQRGSRTAQLPLSF